VPARLAGKAVLKRSIVGALPARPLSSESKNGALPASNFRRERTAAPCRQATFGASEPRRLAGKQLSARANRGALPASNFLTRANRGALPARASAAEMGTGALRRGSHLLQDTSGLASKALQCCGNHGRPRQRAFGGRARAGAACPLERAFSTKRRRHAIRKGLITWPICGSAQTVNPGRHPSNSNTR
jgi:hypothetical protein